jgi:hypothetical protein
MFKRSDHYCFRHTAERPCQRAESSTFCSVLGGRLRDSRSSLRDVEGGYKPGATGAGGRCSRPAGRNLRSRLGRSARFFPGHCRLYAIRSLKYDDPLIADSVIRDHPHAFEGVAFTLAVHFYLCALTVSRSRELFYPRKDRVFSFTTMVPVWELLLCTVAGAGISGG